MLGVGRDDERLGEALKEVARRGGWKDFMEYYFRAEGSGKVSSGAVKAGELVSIGLYLLHELALCATTTRSHRKLWKRASGESTLRAGTYLAHALGRQTAEGEAQALALTDARALLAAHFPLEQDQLETLETFRKLEEAYSVVTYHAFGYVFGYDEASKLKAIRRSVRGRLGDYEAFGETAVLLNPIWEDWQGRFLEHASQGVQAGS